MKQNSLNKSSEDLELDNGEWLKATDNAGTGEVNMLRTNTDDEIDAGANINIGQITSVDDAGAIVLCDLPVTTDSADGTEMSWTIKIGGVNVVKIYGESNGLGSVDTLKVQLLNKSVLSMQDSAGTTHTYTADTDGSLIIS